MRAPRLTVILALALAMATMGVVACKSTTPTGKAKAVGRYVVQLETEHLDTVVGYRYAATNPGGDWLVLQLAVTCPVGSSATLRREGIAVETPSGEKVKLATQAEFNAAYDQLQKIMHAARVIRDPLGYFPPRREPCKLELFSPPGDKVTFDQVSVDYWRACAGLLYFHVPGGVTPGAWALELTPDGGTTLRLPFTL